MFGRLLRLPFTFGIACPYNRGMARFVKFDRRYYNSDGLIPLIRGDDWLLQAKVVDRYAGYEREVDLNDVDGATAFFEAATGGTVANTISITDAGCGNIQVALDSLETPNVAESTEGRSLYVRFDRAGELETVYTLDQPLMVSDAGFLSP